MDYYKGFGRQIILDVAVTGVDGQSSASDDLPDRPLQIRYDQGMAKYDQIADQNILSLLPLLFLTLGKLKTLLRVCLGSRFMKSWMLSKVRLSYLRLSL